MDKQEAKLVLQAFGPNERDAPQPAFAEAMALVENDPELKAWWHAQQAFDRSVSAKLKEVPIPEDLRASILAGRKIEQIRPHSQFSFWLAAAAAVAIFCALGTSQYYKAFGPVPRDEYTATILPLLNQDAPSLAMTSTDRNQIMSWLKQRNAPTGTIPARMADMPTVGCQTYSVHGHPVSLICFAMPSGALAHMFIIDEKALIDPPGNGEPWIINVDGWNTAAWSDGNMSYIVATQSSADALKQLL